MDFRGWCRLCGNPEGSAELSSSGCFLVEHVLEIPAIAMAVCNECNVLITEFDNLLKKARKLDRLFTGLQEETDFDLTTERLNAYRDHFSLTRIPEVKKEQAHFDFIEQEQDSDLEAETVEEPEIIEEFFEDEEIIENVVDEIYLEDNLELDESMQCEETIFSSEEVTDLYQKSNGRLEKTENEKLFNFKCQICVDEFNNMRLLTQHCKSVHNTIPFVKCCSESCGATLSTWRRLIIHKEKHFPDENSAKLRCEICKRTFVSQVAFEKHVESHNLRYICSQCGKDFKEPKTLKSHEETHLLPIEVRRNHSCLQPSCDMKFITKQAMENHYKVKHERAVKLLCDNSGCGKAFFTKKSLYEHKRNHTSVRNYACKHCNFKAKTSSALQIHQDVHKVGEAVSCDICNATFPTLRKLKAHMVSHSNLTPFVCCYCDSSFKRKKDLKDHENIHTKERPFNCLFCPKTFANAANCRKHKVKDHGEELKLWEAENGIGGRKKLECYQ